MKKLVFLTLSLVLLLMVVPGCITVQAPEPNPIAPVGQSSVIGSFSSNPTAINPGGSSTLSWNVTGANSVSIDQGIGQVNVSGSMLVSPSTSTVYTISATNAAGTVTRSSTTTVNSTLLIPGAGIVVGVIPYESGSIVKNGMEYTKSHSICVGDTGGSTASRAFLSFDISSIPGNAQIEEVSLNLGGYTTTGSPTYSDPINGPQYGNFGAIRIERYQYGTYEDLDTFAYNRPGELVASGEITTYPLSTWNLGIMDPVDGKLSVQGLVTAGQPNFQLKIQFFTSTNWDGVRDMLCFDEAILTVKYRLP